MSTIEFTISGEALWNRMERAVERVHDRLPPAFRARLDELLADPHG